MGGIGCLAPQQFRRVQLETRRRISVQDNAQEQVRMGRKRAERSHHRREIGKSTRLREDPTWTAESFIGV